MDSEDYEVNYLGRGLFALGLGAYIAFLPLNWLSLGNVGGLEFRLSYLAVAIMSLALLILRWRGRLAIGRVPIVLRFTFVFSCYLAVLFSSTFTGEFHPEGLGTIVKQIISLLTFLVIVELVIDAPMEEHSMARLIYIASAIGLVLFIAVAFMVFASQGKNLFVEYVGAITRGDTTTLRFHIYRTLFSLQTNAEDVNVSMKNGLNGAFCVIYYLLLAFGAPSASSGSRWMPTIKWLGVLTCATIVVTSLSRSNVLVLMIGTVVGFIPSVRSLSSRILVLPTLLSPLVLVGLIFAAERLLEATDEVLVSRFQTLAEDGRVEMFSKAISEIAQADSWWLGAGVGSKVDYGSNEIQIHNLFLASWYEAGIPAFAFAFTFYLIVISAWVNLVFRYRDAWWPFECSPTWLAALITLPLIRMMVGGQGGNMSVNDWFAVAFVFAVYGSAQLLQVELGDEDDDELEDGDVDEEEAALAEEEEGQITAVLHLDPPSNGTKVP